MTSRAACLSANTRAKKGGRRGGGTAAAPPAAGDRGTPARAARRHLGSRLLTARAALSNSLQSRPPTPGRAPGPWTRPPAAPLAPLSTPGSLSPAPPLSAVLIQRRLCQWAVPFLVPRGCRGRRPTRTSHRPRAVRRRVPAARAAPNPSIPTPTPIPPMVLTSA